MSYLTEVASNLESEVYDYHLPHTKTIDLIGEEFAPRKHNVIVESLGSTTISSNATTSSSGLTQNFGPNVVFVNANGTSSMPIQVQQLLQQAQQQVFLSRIVTWLQNYSIVPILRIVSYSHFCVLNVNWFNLLSLSLVLKI